MKLSELALKSKELYKDKERGLPLLSYPETRDRLTGSRMRDLGTHVGYIKSALGRASADQVDASELSDDTWDRVAAYLVASGKSASIVGSTKGTFTLLRGLAIEEGITIAVRVSSVRPQRNAVYRRIDGEKRRYVKIARAAFVSNNDPYGLRYEDWPPRLKHQFKDGIEPFFIDPHAEKPSSKRPASPAYMRTWLNGMERVFGFLVVTGTPVEDLCFELAASYDTIVRYRKWLYERRGNQHTSTTRGDLERLRHLAASWFDDVETGRKATHLIRKGTHFVTVKDKGELVMRVHADDLYMVWAALVAEAEHYEANVNGKYKYGRVNPMALAAHKWVQAGVWGLTLITWLREENVATATPRTLFKLDDGTWFFRFPRQQMKSKREHADHVIDLWRGDQSQLLLERVLAKVVEMRPHLVERFKVAYPDLDEPQQFFLNQKGRPYSCNALRNFFTSASVRYLGKEKRISMHDVRAIVPTWLFVREQEDAMKAVQIRLDHRYRNTTEQFYLKVEKLFTSRFAKAHFDEKDKQRKLQARLEKMPDEMMAMIERLLVKMNDAHSGEIGAEVVNQLACKLREEFGLNNILPS